MSMNMTRTHLRAAARHRGFTLVEMIVVTLLLLIAMLGLLAVFDASARINKSETDVADAQGAVRYGIYQMTSVDPHGRRRRALRDPGGPEREGLRHVGHHDRLGQLVQQRGGRDEGDGLHGDGHPRARRAPT